MDELAISVIKGTLTINVDYCSGPIFLETYYHIYSTMLKAWSECPATSDGTGPQWPHTEAVQCHWHSDWHSDCPWSKLPLRLWPGLLTVVTGKKQRALFGWLPMA
jgi:hypothetical protein